VILLALLGAFLTDDLQRLNRGEETWSPPW